MNVMALAETHPGGTGRASVRRPTVRVTLREIREYAYRALVVAGASPGEAATAAGQVLHGELHAGVGLAGLVTDLERGPWPGSGMRCTRRRGGRLLEVDCGARVGELRVAAPLVDLVAGEPEAATAVTPTGVPVTALVDDLLLAASTTTGTAIAAVGPRPDGACGVRVATASGDLGVGLMGASYLTGLEAAEPPVGFAVLSDSSLVPTRQSPLTWVSAAELSARRRQAAVEGVMVDITSWTVVAEHAHRFLVPERGP